MDSRGGACQYALVRSPAQITHDLLYRVVDPICNFYLSSLNNIYFICELTFDVWNSFAGAKIALS